MRRAAAVTTVASLIFAGACATILGIRPDAPQPFEHRAHVLEGVPCTQCHRGMEEAGDEGDLHLPTTDTCLECHAEPHDPNTCRDCHSLPHIPEKLVEAKHYLLFDHSQHIPVLQGNCANCHQGVKEDQSPLIPKMAYCFSCHQHEGQWEARQCDACHENLHGSGALRPASHVVHDIDFLKTHGNYAASQGDLCQTCHTESYCAQCHGINVPALPQRLAFDRPTLSNFHRAGFRSRHAFEARADPGLCLACHTDNTCRTCHEEKGLSATASNTGNPHPAVGWVGPNPGDNGHGRAARRDPVGCASCHGGAGEQLCVSCHKVGGVGGNIHPPGFESNLDVRTHAPCRYCHL